MKYKTLRDVFVRAKKEKYAVPHFNINGALWLEAILESAIEYQFPVIIGVTDRNVERLGGYSYIRKFVDLNMERYSIKQPVVLHLDHGQKVESCLKAIDAGFSSVMYDGSNTPFEENVKNTLKVTEYAKKFGVSVEGELGGIGGTEDGVTGGIEYATPEDCMEFVQRTGVDALAAALGSVHGIYYGEANLQFDTMKIISEQLAVPLVLHGASGLSREDITKAIKYGHRKINFNTELNQGCANAVKALFKKEPDLYDPKIILNTGKSGIKEVILDKVQQCGAENKI